MSLPKDFTPESTGPSKYTLNNLVDKVKIRVLSDFITGKSVWGDVDGKRTPTRRKMGQPIPVGNIGVNRFSGEPERIKQFIAAVVWNYTTEQVEIFETDKSTIIGQIFEIEANEDWGDSKRYDLTITKSGENMETKYSVLPSNLKDFVCPQKWQTVNLQALYTNDDPFAENEAPQGLTDADIDEIDEAIGSGKPPF